MASRNEIDCTRIESGPKNAIELFKTVMRFEYALKASGFVRSNSNRLEVRWQDYVSSCLKADFFDHVRDRRIARTLLENPPQKQYLDHAGNLDFKPVPQPANNQQLFDALIRLRNNLFHGGKSGDVDHDRNEVLISEALSVLHFALAQSETVRLEFEGRH